MKLSVVRFFYLLLLIFEVLFKLKLKSHLSREMCWPLFLFSVGFTLPIFQQLDSYMKTIKLVMKGAGSGFKAFISHRGCSYVYICVFMYWKV